MVCFDRIDIAASVKNISCLSSNPNFRFLNGDINDREEALRYILALYKIDCVFHFAAYSHVQDSFVEPLDFTQNNVVGTNKLLEAARHYGKVKRFIHVSTDEIYGETCGRKVDETSNYSPTSPYAASKAAAEMYAMAYLKSFGLPVIIVRSNNVYGPCQYPESRWPESILHYPKLANSNVAQKSFQLLSDS